MSSNAILSGLRHYSGAETARSVEVNAPGLGAQIDLLQQNLSLSRAEVIRCREPELTDRLNRILAQKQIKRLCYGREAELSPLAAALEENIEAVRYDEEIESFREQLFDDIDAGLTTCDAALAESGTLVLYSSAQRPRLLSLVPPMHIAIVRANRIHFSMQDWLRDVDAASVPSNMILISGPSKSADIEQVLAYGVHGPKALVVFLVESE